jgi:hypothetical protein
VLVGIVYGHHRGIRVLRTTPREGIEDCPTGKFSEAWNQIKIEKISGKREKKSQRKKKKRKKSCRDEKTREVFSL